MISDLLFTQFELKADMPAGQTAPVVPPLPILDAPAAAPVVPPMPPPPVSAPIFRNTAAVLNTF